MRTIKKHKSRKLYDTSTSRFISLKDVANISRQEKINVISCNAEDITLSTLLDAMAGSEMQVNEVIEVLNKYVE